METQNSTLLKCDKCGKANFKSQKGLTQHKNKYCKYIPSPSKINKTNVIKHQIKTKKGLKTKVIKLNTKPKCTFCNVLFKNNMQLLNHIQRHISGEIKDKNKKMFEGVVDKMVFRGNDNTDATGLINDYVGKYKKNIFDFLKEKRNVKYKIIISVIMKHEDGHYQTVKLESPYHVKLGPLSISSFKKIKGDLHTQYDLIGNRLRGSGWCFSEYTKLAVETVNINVLGGSSYIPMPFINSNNYINPKNTNDNMCFQWAILAAFHSEGRTDKQRINQYRQFINNYNWEGIDFPTPINQIKTFEKNNDIKINVFTLERKSFKHGMTYKKRDDFIIAPLYFSKFEFDIEVNLLLLDDNEKNHYVWIKNFKSAVMSQIPTHTNAIHEINICKKCLTYTTTSNAFEVHKRLCLKNETGISIMPSGENTKIKFNKLDTLIKVPFTMYADIEAMNIAPEAPDTIEAFMNKHKDEFKNVYNEIQDEYYIDDVISELQIEILLVHENNVLFRSPNEEGFSYLGDGLYNYVFPRTINDLKNYFNAEIRDRILDQYRLPNNTILVIKTERNLYPVNKKTIKLSKQVATCINIRLLSNYPLLHGNESKTFFGENCVVDFVKYINDKDKKFNKILKETNIEYNLTNEEINTHNETTECWICKKQFEITNNDKVIDHDHFDGKYRGAAHRDCNILVRIAKFVPIYFHNLSKYDLHLFIKELAKQNKPLKPIPVNDETYISLQYGCIRFTDSLRLFQKSLNDVSKSMNENDFIELKKEFCIENYRLMLEKGVYPYDYITSFEKYNEIQLPPIEAFYSRLTKKGITDIDYERAQEVWNKFNCRTLKDYTLLYLKQDVCLLADCFEKFRNSFIQDPNSPAGRGLDPAHFVSTPGLTWMNGLYQTGIELDLLTDYDMHLMIENGIRGGVSSVMGDRYVKAHNKEINPKCDEYRILDKNEFNKLLEQMKLPLSQRNYKNDLKKNYLLYVDANNLYGYAMCQYLPYKDFKWVEQSPELINKILNTPKDSDIGYILEVDLEYTDKVSTVKFPLAPEHASAVLEDLSDYQKNLNGNKEPKTKKLMLTVKDKKEYVIDYRNLQFYLKHGMTLKKVHRIMSFEQKPWLKKYIEQNTNKRTLATTTFEKDIYKLLNNAFFGKTMENVRKRQNIELVTDGNKMIKIASKATFKSVKRFTDNFGAVHKYKTQVKLNKPIYLGFCILELSKLLMYETYYEVFEPKFKDTTASPTDSKSGINILYGDTDSFIFNIYTEDIYKDLEDLKDTMDFSEYPTDHPLYSTVNKKVVGKMKDELLGDVMIEWVALRSKCYAYKTLSGKETTKDKGVQKSSVPKLEKYKECLFESKLFYATNTNMRNQNHEIYVQEVNKLALNPYDDKRYICGDGITTLPLGYL
jgi:hypothetical protein